MSKTGNRLLLMIISTANFRCSILENIPHSVAFFANITYFCSAVVRQQTYFDESVLAFYP